MAGGEEGLVEIAIGEPVTLINGETFVTGIIRGIRLDDDEEVEIIWLQHIDFGFFIAHGWLIAEDFSDDELEEIEKLNRMLNDEGEENG